MEGGQNTTESSPVDSYRDSARAKSACVVADQFVAVYHHP